MVGALVCAALLAANAPQDPTGQIAAIEKKVGGRIGLVALERGSGRKIDIAILEPPGGQPVFLAAIYTEGSATLSSEQHNAAVAERANVVATTFAASP